MARGRIILFFDWLTRPAPIERTDRELKELARELRGLALYDCKECPVCIRTRRVIHQLNMPLERRDIRKSPIYRDDLLAGVGRISTPCLRVEENGGVRWIHDADAIVDYLSGRFGPGERREAA